jgi:peptidylprolyl isomerase
MKAAILSLSALAAAALFPMPTPLAAQAPATHTAARSAALVHHAAAGGCVTLPALSPKIPALPPGPCAKALYTLTRTPDTKVDYVSPLVSLGVREGLGSSTSTFSLAYIDFAPGTGELVRPTKYVSVKYTGYLADGRKFDSSEDHPGKEPISFQYGMHRVIPGWDTGFEGMHVGGKRRLFIPYQLAYGDAGRPPVIPPRSELVFDVEVVSQSDTEPARMAPGRPMPPRPGTPPPGTATPPASSTPPAGTNTPPPVGSTPPAGTTTAPPSGTKTPPPS